MGNQWLCTCLRSADLSGHVCNCHVTITCYLSNQLGDGEKSEAARKEKDRLFAYRRKCKAALTIQLAWRKYLQRKKKKELEQKQNQTKVFRIGSEEWRRELAALVIQLAWRQYLRRKLLKDRTRRQRVFHEWSPSVLAARQRVLVERVYSRSMLAVVAVGLQ